MSYNKAPWPVRATIMGDTAEQRFEAVQDGLNVKWARYGLSRPPFPVIPLPRFIRYTPDYLLADRLVEVQGMGRDRLLKVKTDKHAALMAWSDMVLPVDLWVWDSHRSKYTQIPVWEIPTTKIGVFDDGKPYYEVAREDLGDWSSPP